jgi:hypothetical protein
MGHNLYFIFNWNSTHLVHEIATRLSANSTVERVGGLAVGRQCHQVLQEQTDINYRPLHCVQDLVKSALEEPVDASRLEEIEEKFGDPTLLRYILADRHIIQYAH